MYKLIAIDMDGTLLKNDRTISNLTKMKLRSAVDLGIKVVLISGRPIQGIKKYLMELGLTGGDDYAIVLNGALVYKTNDYSVITRNALLTGKDLKCIYAKVKVLKTYFHAFTSKDILVNRRSKFSDDEEKKLNLPIRVVDFNKDIKDDEMIEYAGLGVAMGNSETEIRKLANYVTRSNEEDGVSYVIDKFILNLTGV